MIALGLDPGFASFGWAAVRVQDGPTPIDPVSLDLLALGVIRTKKAQGKVLLRDDDHRRCGEIVRALLAVTREHRPAILCAEAFSHGGGGPEARKQVATIAKMGRAWGIVDTLCEVLQAGLLQVSPQTIKKATTGQRKASKAEVRRALDERLSGQLEAHLAGIRATKQHEHPVDALGSIVASLDHDHFRLARAVHARAS